MNQNRITLFAGCILSLILLAPLASASFIRTNDNALEEGNALYQKQTDVETKFDNCEENDKVCLLHQRLQTKRIKQFKTDLLKKLNMKEPPNVSMSDLPSQLTIAALKKKYEIDRLEKRSAIDSQKIETKEVISMAKLSKLLYFFRIL